MLQFVAIMRFELYLLGSFKILSGNGLEKQSLLERKTRAILAYLAAAETTHSRRFLWELFCQTAKDPAGSLRWHLSRIRRVLSEDILHITPHEVALNTAVAQTDLNFFQQMFHDPTAQSSSALRQAFDHYRGPFLEDVSLKNTPDFDLWVLGERTRTQQLFEKGGVALINQTIAQQNYTRAIPLAHKLLQTDSLLEKAHHQLIWLYAQIGQRESALKQFEHCQTLLQQELAVDPSREILALQTAVRNNLPLPQLMPKQSAVSEKEVVLATKTDFIGRQAERQQLQDSWSRMRQNGRTTVLVEAVAGGGKTRLVAQFCQTLELGAQAYIGNCYQSTRTLPYQPWLTVLELWLERLDQKILTQIPLAWQGQLARLLPHLFSSTASTSEQQEHLFRAIAYLFFETRKATTILFIDDLQWADEASLQLFLFLSRYRIRTASPTLLIGSFRGEEVVDNLALQALLNDMERDAQVTRLALSPLTANEVDLLIEQLWPHKRPLPHLAELKEKLLAETGGNPLFLTELLRELGQTAVLPEQLPIPPSLQALTTQRLQQLPTSSRQLLETLAILDRPIHFDMAQQISGRSEDETITAIEQGLRWHFLESRPSAQYDFSHDLIRQAILQQISKVRRQRLHHRAAATLVQHNQDAATLAYHWEMAGVPAQVATFALQAGDESLAQVAFQDAITFYQKHLTGCPRLTCPVVFRQPLALLKH